MSAVSTDPMADSKPSQKWLWVFVIQDALAKPLKLSQTAQSFCIGTYMFTLLWELGKGSPDESLSVPFFCLTRCFLVLK